MCSFWRGLELLRFGLLSGGILGVGGFLVCGFVFWIICLFVLGFECLF